MDNYKISEAKSKEILENLDRLFEELDGISSTMDEIPISFVKKWAKEVKTIKEDSQKYFNKADKFEQMINLFTDKGHSFLHTPVMAGKEEPVIDKGYATDLFLSKWDEDSEEIENPFDVC